MARVGVAPTWALWTIWVTASSRTLRDYHARIELCHIERHVSPKPHRGGDWSQGRGPGGPKRRSPLAGVPGRGLRGFASGYADLRGVPPGAIPTESPTESPRQPSGDPGGGGDVGGAGGGAVHDGLKLHRHPEERQGNLLDFFRVPQIIGLIRRGARCESPGSCSAIRWLPGPEPRSGTGSDRRPRTRPGRGSSPPRALAPG